MGEITPKARVYPLITQTLTSFMADFMSFSTQLETVGSITL